MPITFMSVTLTQTTICDLSAQPEDLQPKDLEVFILHGDRFPHSLYPLEVSEGGTHARTHAGTHAGSDAEIGRFPLKCGSFNYISRIYFVSSHSHAYGG